MNSPRIILNGKTHVIDGINTLEELLASLGLLNKPVVIELDGEAILPSDIPNKRISDGCRVEIISIVAGG